MKKETIDNHISEYLAQIEQHKRDIYALDGAVQALRRLLDATDHDASMSDGRADEHDSDGSYRAL